MGAGGNTVKLTFLGDTRSLEASFRSAANQADGTRSRFAGLARGAKIVAGAFLGGLAVAAKVGFGEVREGAKVTAVTDNAIRKLGQGFAYATDDVKALSEALMNKTGIDDELIQSQANLLLSNRNFTDGLGKTAEGLQRVIGAGIDWAQVTGKDSTAALASLNKAMADPIKGVNLLARSGVAFTGAERERIKALVESGRVTDAQAIILRKLEGAYGGSAAAAEAASGGLNIMRERAVNLAGQIVGAVMPAFSAMVGIVSAVVGWLSAHETTTKVLIGTLAALSVGVFAVNAAVKVWTAAQIVLNAVLTANPIGLVIVAIAALAAGIVIAWQRSETFRNIVKGAFDVVKTAAEAVKTAVMAVVGALVEARDSPAGKALELLLTGHFRLIKAAVTSVDDAIAAIVGALRAVKDWDGWSAIREVFGTTWSAIKSVINTVADAISNVISKAQSAISWIGSLKDKAANLGNKLLPGSPFADGGMVYGPTRALIGEAGPEVVIPLTRPHRAAQLYQRAGLDRFAGASPQGGGHSGPMVHVERLVVQDATDIDRVASRLGRQLLMAGA